jgi:hypothetical protein
VNKSKTVTGNAQHYFNDPNTKVFFGLVKKRKYAMYDPLYIENLIQFFFLLSLVLYHLVGRNQAVGLYIQHSQLEVKDLLI